MGFSIHVIYTFNNENETLVTCSHALLVIVIHQSKNHTVHYAFYAIFFSILTTKTLVAVPMAILGFDCRSLSRQYTAAGRSSN